MNHSEIDTLTQLLSKLPALGPRSARRAVLFLLDKKETYLRPLISVMSDVAEKVACCPICGNMDTQSPCAICQDEKRDKTQLCVIANVADLWALERSGSYKGMYHVLGGVLSALDGIGPEELNIDSLLGKVQSGNIKEVVFALPATMDGQTTMHYLSDILEKYQVQMTALSHGVPVGGELDYLDDGTLQMAFNSRQKL